MEKFSLSVQTEIPYKEWAQDHAALYAEGFIDAVEGVEYTHFQASPWKEGYAAAVAVFARSPEEYKEFIRIRGY